MLSQLLQTHTHTQSYTLYRPSPPTPPPPPPPLSRTKSAHRDLLQYNDLHGFPPFFSHAGNFAPIISLFTGGQNNLGGCISHGDTMRKLGVLEQSTRLVLGATHTCQRWSLSLSLPPVPTSFANARRTVCSRQQARAVSVLDSSFFPSPNHLKPVNQSLG